MAYLVLHWLMKLLVVFVMKCFKILSINFRDKAQVINWWWTTLGTRRETGMGRNGQGRRYKQWLISTWPLISKILWHSRVFVWISKNTAVIWREIPEENTSGAECETLHLCNYFHEDGTEWQPQYHGIPHPPNQTGSFRRFIEKNN